MTGELSQAASGHLRSLTLNLCICENGSRKGEQSHRHPNRSRDILSQNGVRIQSWVKQILPWSFSMLFLSRACKTAEFHTAATVLLVSLKVLDVTC